MGDWQPIYTAPRDGTWVLLAGGEADCNEADPHDERYRDGDATRPVVARWEAYDSGGEWVYGYWDGSWLSTYSEPTHWMPLPTTSANPLEKQHG